MPGSLIVLSGPPLPGRWRLARALASRLGARRFSLEALPAPEEIAGALARGERVIVDGDLPTHAERSALLAAFSAAERLLVSWRCTREQAEHEIFHRYASRPRALADLELERYMTDFARRELVSADEDSLVIVGASLPLNDQVLAVERALGPRAAACDPPGERRPSVLVVEDDPEERAVLAEVLRELGYQVELAPDAAVALALLDEADDIAFVLSDQRMPGLTGVELVRELRDRHPRVRAVLLTGHADEATSLAAMRAHAIAVLAKPVHVIDLARVLESADDGLPC